MKDRISVVHLTDSLDAGGMERVALNLTNYLPPDRYRVLLCATRQAGSLVQSVAPHVRWVCLERKHTADVSALSRFVKLLREEHIDIVHPHGSSLFFAAIAAALHRTSRLVWHCHYGRFDIETPPVWLYRPAGLAVDGVIAVNEPMAEWTKRAMRVRADRVWYVPNFVCPESAELREPLPGTPGRRIVCVANFRPQKDHLTLIHALSEVRQAIPDVHLLLAGGTGDAAYLDEVKQLIRSLDLDRHVSILGERSDISAVLAQSDIGVLSSASEGLPLALLEYGAAGLPVAATQVGQCAEVLDHARAGLLTPPGDATALAASLISLLRSPQDRRMYAERLHERIDSLYSRRRVIGQICSIYDSLLR